MEDAATGGEEDTHRVDTRHEPHVHAARRVWVSIGAIIAVAVVAGVVWFVWGPALLQACRGDTGCSVRPGDVPAGGAHFTVPADAGFGDAAR